MESFDVKFFIELDLVSGTGGHEDDYLLGLLRVPADVSSDGFDHEPYHDLVLVVRLIANLIV